MRPNDLELAGAIQLLLDVVEDHVAPADPRIDAAELILAAFLSATQPPVPSSPSSEPSSLEEATPRVRDDDWEEANN